MNIFLKANMRDIAQKEHAYFSQKHHADVALTQAKRQCKLMMGKPETLLGIASVGLGRTALLSLFQ